MAKLIYAAITSLDGYVEDAGGGFDWAAPDDTLLAFVNDLVRPVGTYLYGRRLYQTMVGWETAEHRTDDQPLLQDFAELWRAADKVVFSTTLQAVASARTRIETAFSPEIVRGMKASASADLSVGGAGLASQAFAAGLVDECHLFLHPVVIGCGKPALPDNVRVQLELIDERRLGHVVHLHYRVLA